MSNTAENIIPFSGQQQMNKQLPAPLTPPDADLTAFEWAEFNSHRMQRSDLWIDSTGDEFKAWFALWMYAQHEKPAGTLPNNDRRLSRTVATAGVMDWQSVKPMALHGWVLCSDDRYHHPVVAEAVIRAWDRRIDYLAQIEDARNRKAVEREKRRMMIAAIREAGNKAEWSETTASLTVKFESLGDLSRTSHSDKSVTVTDLSRTSHATCHGLVTPKTETETETETGIINNKHTVQNPHQNHPDGEEGETATAEAFAVCVSDGFKTIWSSMPLPRVSKLDAEKAWKKACKGKSVSQVQKGIAVITQDLADRAAHVAGFDSPFLKTHLATYINGQMWKDEDMPQRFAKLKE
jgi:hypothetical protein